MLKPKVVLDNKLRGAYGVSDMETGKIRINRKKHFQKQYKRVNPTKEGHEDLASTIQHELLHFKHPKAKERTIRRMEKKTMSRITPKRRKQLLATLKR